MKQTLKQLVRKTGLERRHVEAARMYGERQALALAPQRDARAHGRILCYHSVGQPVFGVNDVAPARFRRQIELALELGYRFVPPAKIARTGGGPKDLAVTFDDALKSVLTEADPILHEHSIPYAVFAVSQWSDHENDWQKEHVLSWDDLAAMIELRGVEVGSHSATHRNFGFIDEVKAREELEISHAVMRSRLGFAPETMAIPFGQSSNWTPEADRIAREIGFNIIYAQAEDTRPPNTIARTFVTGFDEDRIFKALLRGAYDRWEEWTWTY
jgi:peptidoglycan/xylan/chitin deacetylase (PgdA/CDA1 family)